MRAGGGDWPSWMRGQAQRAHQPQLQAFYQTFSLTAEQPISETPLVALDLETSGLDPARSAILSIGLIPFDLQRIHLGERRAWVLRPPSGFSGESIPYHHITHSDTQEAPDFADVLPELLDCLAGHLAVVHYHPIERGFLGRAVHQRFKEPLRFPLIDTMDLEARRYRRGWRTRMRAIFGQTPVSIRLGDSRSRYHLPLYEGHQAALDALATAELLQAQIQHHYSPSTAIGQLWI